MMQINAGKRIRFAAAGLILFGWPLAGLPVAFADGFDVLGAHLGMTQSEVEAVVTAYDSRAKIVRKTSRLRYFDGWESQSTDDFVKTLSVQFPVKGGALEIELSTPPAGSRVISIIRKGGYSGPKVEFPPYEKFLQSLINKYGEPVLERRRAAGGELLWAKPKGGKVCLKTSKSLVLKYSESNYDLSDPQECARLLYYDLDPDTPGGPVQRLSATAIDVAEIVRSKQATDTWLRKLSDEARANRSRSTPGNDPDL